MRRVIIAILRFNASLAFSPIRTSTKGSGGRARLVSMPRWHSPSFERFSVKQPLTVHWPVSMPRWHAPSLERKSRNVEELMSRLTFQCLVGMLRRSNGSAFDDNQEYVAFQCLAG